MHGDAYETARLRDPAVRRRLAIMERVILAHVAGCRRVLDVGCGTGRFTVQLRAHDAIGLDRSREMLELARRRDLTCVLGDAHALPFQAGAFDAVVATDHVFSYLDVDRALAEAQRVLTPAGLLAIHYPTHAVWTPRKPLGLTAIPGRRSMPGTDLVAIAHRLAFDVVDRRLWRSLRWYPYLIPVPPWLELKIWSNCVLVFRKRTSA